jgi:two-component system sensor histidine kinase KdpD
VIGQVIRQSGVGIDVHVISHPAGTEDHQLALPQRRRPASLARRRVMIGFGLAVVCPPLLAVVLAQLRDEVGLPSVLLLFLLLVVGVSAVGGLWPGIVAAISGFLLVNWYFTPPLYTFTIGEGENILALAVFLAVAFIVSSFVALAARRAADAGRTHAEAEALFRLAGSAPVSTVLDSLIRVLGLDGAAVLHRGDGGWLVQAASGERVPESPEAASTTVDLDDDHMLALAGAPLRTEDERILEAFTRELTSSVELGELEAQVEAVDALSAASELRSAILSAVSHDLRTPIAAIKASVTSLLQDDVVWTDDERREFLETIDEETDRLNSLVGNLLDMSRIQAGALEISPTPVGLDEVLPAALHSLRLSDGAIALDVPDDLPRVLADPGLLERALANVIENAVRYSPPDRSARVTAGVVDGVVDVRVVDAGPGVRREERSRVFMPFQRLGDAAHDEGVGLGLAVAKGFIEAMGGAIEVEDTPGGGLTVVTRLRSAG